MFIPLSVDIIKDASTPEVDLQLARQGVRYVSQLSKGAFMLMNGPTDSVRIQPHAERIGLEDTYDLIPRSGDFRVLLTGRRLVTPDGEGSLGYAHYINDRRGGLAVITTQGSNKDDIPAVTAHELGHLLGLTYAEGTGDHCADATCLMYHTAQYSERVRLDTSDNPRLENRRYCLPCERQVGSRALRLMYIKKNDLI